MTSVFVRIIRTTTMMAKTEHLLEKSRTPEGS